jgi:hypothetical protein
MHRRAGRGHTRPFKHLTEWWRLYEKSTFLVLVAPFAPALFGIGELVLRHKGRLRFRWWILAIFLAAVFFFRTTIDGHIHYSVFSQAQS